MSLAVSIDPIFWLLCAIGFVVLEAMTWNLVSIWFAVGSAAALLSCLLVQSFRVQAAVFIAVSALCLLAFKPLAKKLRKAPTATKMCIRDRFPHDNAFSFHVNQGIGSTQVDPYIF